MKSLNEREMELFEKLRARNALRPGLASPDHITVRYACQRSNGGAHQHFTVAIVDAGIEQYARLADDLLIGVTMKSPEDEDNPELAKLLALDRALRKPAECAEND